GLPPDPTSRTSASLGIGTCSRRSDQARRSMPAARNKRIGPDSGSSNDPAPETMLFAEILQRLLHTRYHIMVVGDDPPMAGRRHSMSNAVVCEVKRYFS